MIQKETTLLNKIAKTEQLLATGNITHQDTLTYYQNELINYTRQFNEFQQKLIKKYPNQVSPLYHTEYSTLTMIQETLSSNTIWIEYSYNYDKTALYIYTIRKDAINVTKHPLDDAFFKNIKQLQQLLQDVFLIQRTKREQFITVSHQLYQILIAPIQQELEGIEQLFIVPEAALFQIPFEVLLPTAEKQLFHELDYLIKNYTINYHYSATAHFSVKEKTTTQNKSLLAFAPVFKNGQSISATERSLNLSFDFLRDSLYRGIAQDGFTPLPNTEKEIATIYKNLGESPDATILLNESATKENLLQALQKQSYHFIHIATHGLVNFQNIKLSGLACHTPADTPSNRSTSSLLFANEIQRLPIQADLVVLSSCESGIGHLIEGEGLMALNRSFLLAGAKNILFSLWKVQDDTTSDLMADFYKTYLKYPDYAKAIRTAKLKMISIPSSALPVYWAAFVILGE